MKLFLGTDEGLAVFEGQEEEWHPRYVRLRELRVTAVALAGEGLWVGTRDGLWRSLDEGGTVAPAGGEFGQRHVRSLAAQPDSPDTLLVGTEPAAVVVTRDGGRSWTEAPDVARLREEHRWSLPYSPEAGCIRGFAACGARVYAAAEVGGVLRSNDAGDSWDLLEGKVHADVHDVTAHPDRPDVIYAATGGGRYRSSTAGENWALIGDGYTRAVWVDPDQTETVLAGPARYVGAMGRVERSIDGGDTWALAADGIDVPMRDMVERFVSAGAYLLAITADGRLLWSRRGIWMWRALDLGTAPIRAAVVDAY